MATATPGVNPYAKPNAAVVETAEEFQEVKVFSTAGRIVFKASTRSGFFA